MTGKMRKRGSVGITNATIVPMDQGPHVIKDGGVAIYDGKIVRVGRSREIERICDRTIGIEGKLVTPPFLNAHHHTYQRLVSSPKPSMRLLAWLSDVLFREECALSKQDVYQNATRECNEFLRSGVGYLILQESNLVYDEVVRACCSSGMKAAIGRYCGDNNRVLPSCIIEHPAKAMTIINKYRQVYGKGSRLKFSIAPRFLPALTPKALATLKDMLDDDIITQFHVNESLGELELNKEIHGLTPINLLDRVGLLHSHTILSHVIYATPSEKETLYERKPVITISPTANMQLAGDLAPISEYLKNGLLVTVGLDGFAVTRSKTYIEELHTLSHFTDIPQQVIIPRVLLSSATVAMRLFGGGQLTTGAYADILVLDVATESPWEYLSQKLNERDVFSLVLNGEVAYGEPIL